MRRWREAGASMRVLVNVRIIKQNKSASSLASEWAQIAPWWFAFCERSAQHQTATFAPHSSIFCYAFKLGMRIAIETLTKQTRGIGSTKSLSLFVFFFQWQTTLKFAPCDKLGCSKSSIPQIVFQAIVASFSPRNPAFLRPKTRGIMAKKHTALNKE